MIILASAVIISLSNSGIIGKANEAVDASNLKEVQQLAGLIWADAYLNEEIVSDSDYYDYVIGKLEENNIDTEKYNIIATGDGVTVTGTTLGSLITSAEDYGKYVDYTVKVDGRTYDKWQIYYHNSDYVYLISEDIVTETILDKKLTVASLSNTTASTLDGENNTLLDLYNIFRVGSSEKYVLADTTGSNTLFGCKAVVQLVTDYNNFANTTDYGSNVVGAIGGPTIELLVAGWTQKVIHLK